MILHLSDWDNYPSAIVDTTTTNESWLRMASLLKEMKVENHYFHLALHNPKLQGVDPFSPNLTPVELGRIHMEIRENPWYYFREIARVPNGSNPLQFRLSRPILSIYWCIFNSISYYLEMPRQTGKSVGMFLMHNYLRDFIYRRMNTFLFTKDSGLQKKSVIQMKDMQDLYPPLVSTLIKHGINKDLNNFETVTCNRYGNKTITDIGHDVKLRAENVGRGEYIVFGHSDETPWTSNAHLSIPQIQFAMGAARENATLDGTICCDVYTSTAGYKDTPTGKYAYELLMSGTYWNEKFYDAGSKEKAKEIITLNSPAGKCMVKGTFNHRQCGKTDEWLKKRIADTKTTISDIENNLLLKWLNGALVSFLTKSQIEVITASEMAPLYTEISDEGYVFDWFIPENEIETIMSNGQFGLGLDSSQIVGSDANALILRDFKDLSVIARGRVTEGSLFKYGKYVANLLIAYENITLVPENKASGQALIDHIVHELISVGINPYKRIYNRVIDNPLGLESEDVKLVEKCKGLDEKLYENTHKKLFGFSTNGDNRRFLYDTVIQNAVSSTGHLVRDEILSDELKGLITKNGRVDHSPGGHDDLVVSWLLVDWFIRHSTNLNYYRINPTYSLSMVADNGSTLSPEQIKVLVLTSELKKEISELKDKIKRSTSFIDNKRNERILEVKVNQLKNYGDTSVSLDSILQDISESRKGSDIRTNILRLQQQRATNYYSSSFANQYRR
jgi:hypothetical protein